MRVIHGLKYVAAIVSGIKIKAAKRFVVSVQRYMVNYIVLNPRCFGGLSEPCLKGMADRYATGLVIVREKDALVLIISGIMIASSKRPSTIFGSLQMPWGA